MQAGELVCHFPYKNLKKYVEQKLILWNNYEILS